MKKKILAVFLSLCMAMSLLPTTVLAAEGDNPSTWDELEEAISNTTTGTITLGGNISTPSGDDGIIKIENNKDIILDLNEHTLTASLYVSGAKLTITNGTVKLPVTGGSLNATPVYVHGSDDTSAAADYSLVNVESSATLDGTDGYGMIISGPEYTSNASYGATINIKGTVNGPIFISGNMGNSSALDANAKPTTINVLDDADLNDTLCMNGAAVVNVYDGATITGDDAVAIKRGTLNVYGGTFEAVGVRVDPAVANTNGSETTGSAISVTSTYNNTNSSISVNIMGGTFTSQNNAAVYVGHSTNKGTQTGYRGSIDVSIEDGSFTGGQNVAAVYIADKIEADTGVSSGKNSNVVENAITGGTFSSDVKDYFPEGAILTQDQQGKVVPDTSSETPGVAEVNEVPYDSLANAIAMAKDGDTVQIVANTTIDASINVDTSLTIDLNGCTVTGLNNAYSLRILGAGVEVTIDDNSSTGTGKITSGRNDSGGIVQVADAAKLTLESGTIEATGPNGGSPVLVIGSGGNIGADRLGATFNMTGGTLHANGYYALAGNGTWDGTNITISGGNIISEQCAAIYHPQEGRLTLTGGTISGTTAVQVCGGTLNIPENSTVVVTATGEDNRAGKEGDGLIDDGAAISIVNRGSGYDDVDATIAGGTFRSENSEAVMSYAWANNNIDENGIIVKDFINGGNFSNPIDQAYLGDNLTAELYSLRNTEAPYSYYDSVEDAQAAGQPGDVVTDLSDVNASTTTRYDVVFHHGNGTTQTLSVYDGATITLPDLPDQGYNHFQGWTDQNGKHYEGRQEVTISSNMTFTAVWTYIPPANPNYKITIGDMENGTVTADPAAAKAGATVTLTATPDEGYALGTITVTDRFGDAVKVTENADGTYTFTMPNGQVTVTATFVQVEEPAPTEPFVDVAEGDWFYDAVVYAYQNELMNGVGDNRFAPNSATTRGMLVTILYRLEGEPAVTGEAGFDDVGDTWYTDAVIWAAANDIVNGIGDNQFGPENTLTREQLVTMLYRYAQNKGYDVTASADLSGYPDAGQIQSWAQDAMTWAVAEGIVEGMDGNLNPAGHATRAQIATILMRFCEGVAK